MPAKSETVLENIRKLPNTHCKSFLDFKAYLEDEGNSERNIINYLKILNLFSKEIGNKDLKQVSKDEILAFLDRRQKNIEEDSDKKWIRTWNDYLNRLIGFYRWLHNQNKDKDEWSTPYPINSIKRKQTKRISTYNPNDVWTGRTSYSSKILP